MEQHTIEFKIWQQELRNNDDTFEDVIIRNIRYKADRDDEYDFHDDDLHDIELDDWHFGDQSSYNYITITANFYIHKFGEE
tara:strand:- start:72 stop:314 length:243 start_codon:yes stop_codon:yes gene_type:complete